jgi:hypothetical protein
VVELGSYNAVDRFYRNGPKRSLVERYALKCARIQFPDEYNEILKRKEEGKKEMPIAKGEPFQLAKATNHKAYILNMKELNRMNINTREEGLKKLRRIR